MDNNLIDQNMPNLQDRETRMEKEALRETIQRETDVYLAKGNEVEHVDTLKAEPRKWKKINFSINKRGTNNAGHS